MKKISFELPKYRLHLHVRLVKRRKPLMAEPIFPSLARVHRKYRSGSTLGKYFRHFSDHKSARKILNGTLAVMLTAGVFIPQGSIKNQEVLASDTVIQAQTTFTTEKSIQF